MRNKIKTFYNQDITPIEHWLFGLSLAGLVVGLVYIAINALFTHYDGNWFSPPSWLLATPVMLALTLLGISARQFMPRTGFIIRTYGLFFCIASMAQGAVAYGIQFTPFPIIDDLLIRVDQWLGFDTLVALDWTYAHHWLRETLNVSYATLIIELGLLPFVVILLQEQRATNLFFLAVLVSFLIGTTVYYFFPTVAPAGIFHSPHFTESQLATSLKFYQLHHHLPITTSDGGLIAFPSFHVVWAVLLTYLCKPRKWLYYPLIAWNTLIVVATVLLGWHYLVDAVAGLVLAFFGIVVAEWIYRRYATAADCVTLSVMDTRKTKQAVRSFIDEIRRLGRRESPVLVASKRAENEGVM